MQIWVKQTKTGSKIRFFAFFSSLVHQFSFKLHRIIASNNVSLGKTRKKNRAQICVKWAKIVPKIRFLSFFQVWFISFSGNCIG